MQRVGSGIVAIAAALLAGCGEPAAVKVPVSGMVSYRGEPIEDGEIRFVPEPGTLAPASATMIKAGRYLASARGGLATGRYRVEIRGFRSVPDQVAVDLVDDARTQYLPARFQEGKELRVTIDGSSRRARHDFHLRDE